jgi:hypothetical protein
VAEARKEDSLAAVHEVAQCAVSENAEDEAAPVRECRGFLLSTHYTVTDVGNSRVMMISKKLG